FHGHLCPGLMTGVRAAEIALREIGPRAADEELVAVVETDNCAVDAIQYLLGCTFGKGNLIHLDHGQSVFTIARRSEGERATAIRIAAKPRPSREMTPEQQALAERVRSGQASPEEEQAYAALWRERSLAILDMDEGDLFDVQVLDDYLVPERAGVHPSIRCERCGRMTMSTRVHRLRGQALCVPCFEQALEGAAIFYPIGVVRNELIAGEAAPRAKSSSSRLEIRPELIEALEGIEAFEQLEVLFYFDRAEKNPPLRQHRCGDPSQPLTGVLALRSPARPNAIGLSRVKLLAREENVLFVAGLDAWDGTPILDIKPFEGI
ncbi:MAG: tRNA (N6-threonylcarbamoyladenosine(37)-N6)-methyltransferase TrmO, partial [Chloroflexi bacterium]|nr:tRNA (N6-threonylcarbamoyladenosine(37)-N6)-methyltransferase TrmO [Chloroflexota bacterium]